MPKSAQGSPNIRLSDTQFVALSSAAQREDGTVTVSDRLKGAAAQKSIATLIEKGLAREVRAKPGMPVTRRDEEKRPYALIITKLGRSVINVEGDGDNSVAETPSKCEVGKKAASAKRSAVAKSAKQEESRNASSPEVAGSAAAKVEGRPRDGSKLGAVVRLLSRPNGASLNEIIAATNWLPHTTRAALTGLRKRGYPVERRRVDGETRYGVAAPQASEAA